MKQVVDFTNEESLSKFILKFKIQFFDSNTNYRDALRKAGMASIPTVSQLLSNENVI
jgi:hypothetical protein